MFESLLQIAYNLIMNYLFYTLIVAIMGTVLYLGVKAINTGLDARSNIK